MSETIVEHNSGIYRIINTLNGQFYIGSSRNLHRRKIDHYKLLRHNKHKNPKLQNSFNKYKESNFTFSTMLYCDDVNLEYFENVCIAGLHPQFNIEKTSIRRSGDYRHSTDTLRKLSVSHLGKPSGKKGSKLGQYQIDILRNVNIGNQNASKTYNVDLESPLGMLFIGPIKNLRKFGRENGIVSHSVFMQFVKGQKRSYLGWRII